MCKLDFSLCYFLLVFFRSSTHAQENCFDRGLWEGFAVLHGLCKREQAVFFVFLSGQGHLHIMSISTQKFIDWAEQKWLFLNRHRTKNMKSNTFIFEAQPALCTFFFLIHIFFNASGNLNSIYQNRNALMACVDFISTLQFNGQSCGLFWPMGPGLP